MRIAQEEIFGPVLTVLTFEDMDELVEKANSTIYGLAAGIWTRDIGKAHTLAGGSRQARSGSMPTASLSAEISVRRIQTVRIRTRIGTTRD